MSDRRPFSYWQEWLRATGRGLPTELEQVAEVDARFLADVIEDNEHSNAKGLAASGLATMLEMSDLCHWGDTYTKGRFNRALRQMEKLPTVAKVGERWFWHTCPTLQVVDESGHRVCERPKCGKDITHMRANARFCSRRCNLLDTRDATK